MFSFKSTLNFNYLENSTSLLFNDSDYIDIYTKKFIYKILDNKIDKIEFKNINQKSTNLERNLYVPIIIKNKEFNCNNVILNALKLNKSINHIIFTNCTFSDNTFFKHLNKNYTKLTLNNSINKIEELKEILKMYPNIKSLELNYNSLTEIDDELINIINNRLIEELTINNSKINFICNLSKRLNVNSLKKLNFNYNDISNLDVLNTILQNNKLEKIEIAFNRIFNINQINELLTNCSNLKYLDISMNYINDLNMINNIKSSFPNVEIKI